MQLFLYKGRVFIVRYLCVQESMKTRTLQFEKLFELEMFIEMIDKKPCEINKELLQVSGAFPEKDVELAKSAFAAIVSYTYKETGSRKS
jgi:hypothetical protein